MIVTDLQYKFDRRVIAVLLTPVMLLVLSVFGSGCDTKDDTKSPEASAAQSAGSPQQHSSTTGETKSDSAEAADSIPRFAVNSPFDPEYKSIAPDAGKRIWATSFLWEKAPPLVVEKWLTEKPDTAGKYVLTEFWATWCGPCRRTIPKLNLFHEKFRDRLVVIGVSDQTEQEVRDFNEHKIDYCLAVDTMARTKKQLGVSGIPHVIITEPGGHVVWEGFPLLEGYELTEDIVAKIISVAGPPKGSP